MKKLIIVSILLVTLNYSYSQTSCDVNEKYGDFIKVRKEKFDDREFIVKQITGIDQSTCSSDVINNNLIYIDYLLTNFSSNSNYQNLLQLPDSLSLQREYIK